MKHAKTSGIITIGKLGSKSKDNEIVLNNTLPKRMTKFESFLKVPLKNKANQALKVKKRQKSEDSEKAQLNQN